MSDTINPRCGRGHGIILSSINITLSICFVARTRRTPNCEVWGHPKKIMRGVTIPLAKSLGGKGLRIVSIVSAILICRAGRIGLRPTVRQDVSRVTDESSLCWANRVKAGETVLSLW